MSMQEAIAQIEKAQSAIAQIERALTDAGPNPEYHRQEQERLRHRWPTLFNALEALMVAIRGRPPVFTRDDVKNLRAWAYKSIEVATDDGDFDNQDVHDDDERRGMYALAAKIEALLPPEAGAV